MSGKHYSQFDKYRDNQKGFERFLNSIKRASRKSLAKISKKKKKAKHTNLTIKSDKSSINVEQIKDKGISANSFSVISIFISVAVFVVLGIVGWVLIESLFKLGFLGTIFLIAAIIFFSLGLLFVIY